MNYADCVTVLRAFRSQFGLLYMSDDVREVRVAESAGVYQLEVGLASAAAAASLAQHVPAQWSVDLNGQSILLPVIHRQTSPIRAQVAVRPGDPAAGIDLAGFGTAGWTIYLNGTLVCISNWHVLCGRGNATPIGRPILLNGARVAHLHAFEPVYFGSAINGWDYALAAYDDVSAPVEEMRRCQDGTTLLYPRKLSPNVQIGGEHGYRKVGARSPTCRSGKMVGVSDIQVSYSSADIGWFHGQLAFQKMTDPGDSGAVIVRENDNTVTGLNFAGNDDATYANALFTMGWRHLGTRIINDFEVPDFGGSLTPADAFASVMERAISSSQLLEFPSQDTPLLPPDLAVGTIVTGSGGAVVRQRIDDIRGPWLKIGGWWYYAPAHSPWIKQ